MADCDKTFRKKSGLNAHMRHYHADVAMSPDSVPASETIQLASTNSVILSDCSSSLAGTRDNSSASDTEGSTSGKRETVTVYKCTCGWTGDAFWNYADDGTPLRNHICKRPRAARNLKQTHLNKEQSRIGLLISYSRFYQVEI